MAATLRHLSGVLADLEDRFDYDVEATLRQATDIERVAAECGDVVLSLRARLMMANMWRRTGDLAAAARTGWEVNAWAVEHDSSESLCCSHMLMSGVYDGLGDPAAALEHAVEAAKSPRRRRHRTGPGLLPHATRRQPRHLRLHLKRRGRLRHQAERVTASGTSTCAC